MIGLFLLYCLCLGGPVLLGVWRIRKERDQ